MTVSELGRRLAMALPILAISAGVARAHVDGGAGEAFLAGVSHPISGWDHILAMVSVGVWGALLAAPAIWVLPITFPMMMAVGGLLGLAGISLPGVELGIALSMVALGGAIALKLRPPLPVVMLVVGVFAIFHGYAHGAELSEGQDFLLFSIGFVIATGVLHLFGIGLGLAVRWDWGPAVLQTVGVAVGLAGLAFAWSAA